MYCRLLKIDPDTQSSYFIFGPRGTGKTSWLKSTFPDATLIDLLDFSIYKHLNAHPDQLSHYFPKNHQNEWIIIDEVQRTPELLNEVHRLIESEGKRFILTGSSARKLRQKGVNLLAGRALVHHMHPLTAQEIGDDFDLNKALAFGLLPNAVTKENPLHYLQSYVDTYVREEVMQEGLTRNIVAFTRFLETASFSQGALINTTQIAREVSISRPVVDSYFQILEDLLIAKRLYCFNKRAKRSIVAHPKFYYFDAGVFRHLRPQGPMDLSSESDGAALETLVYQSLLAINDYNNLQYQFYFWRTSQGAEIDFVAYGPNGFIGIEVKRKKNIGPNDLKGLKLFHKDYPQAKRYMFYGGKHSLHMDGITVLPMTEALKTLPDLLQN